MHQKHHSIKVFPIIWLYWINVFTQFNHSLQVMAWHNVNIHLYNTHFVWGVCEMWRVTILLVKAHVQHQACTIKYRTLYWTIFKKVFYKLIFTNSTSPLFCWCIFKPILKCALYIVIFQPTSMFDYVVRGTTQLSDTEVLDLYQGTHVPIEDMNTFYGTVSCVDPLH